MSSALPLSYTARLSNYIEQNGENVLTPAQRKRYFKKVLHNVVKFKDVNSGIQDSGAAA